MFLSHPYLELTVRRTGLKRTHDELDENDTKDEKSKHNESVDSETSDDRPQGELKSDGQENESECDQNKESIDKQNRSKEDASTKSRKPTNGQSTELSDESLKKEFEENYDRRRSLSANVHCLPFKKRERMFKLLADELASGPFESTNLLEIDGYGYRKKDKKSK